MLARMRELKDSKKHFNLDARNCSYTVGSILESGESDEMKKIINPKAMGNSFGTPQAVLEGALQYQNLIYSNLNHSLSFNPLKTIKKGAGKLLRNTTNDNNPAGVRLLSGVGLTSMVIPTGIAAVLDVVGKKILKNKKNGKNITSSPEHNIVSQNSVDNVSRIDKLLENFDVPNVDARPALSKEDHHPSILHGFHREKNKKDSTNSSRNQEENLEKNESRIKFNKP